MLTKFLQVDTMQNVGKMSTQHLVGKEVKLMVNTQLLDEAIRQSGKRKSFLADRLNMSVQTFRLKRLNISAFNTDDVDTLCRELNIKTLTEKDKIFFAKNVD